jgi:hypothetical protein
LRRRILRVPNALNALVLGTYWQIVGISTKPSGKPTILSGNLKKKRPQIRIKSFWPW